MTPEPSLTIFKAAFGVAALCLSAQVVFFLVLLDGGWKWMSRQEKRATAWLMIGGLIWLPMLFGTMFFVPLTLYWYAMQISMICALPSTINNWWLLDKKPPPGRERF